MLRYLTRPISDRTWLRPAHRETSRFTASWSDTLDLLEREYNALDGRDLVIEVDVREKDIRNDGLLRADARADSPAVVVAFESKHGPLLYRCDHFERSSWSRSSMDSWQHNVRAVAMTLEALRAVDRYAASRHGEQYRGYKAIESVPVPEAMPVPVALALLAKHASLPPAEAVADVARAARRAQRATHPDHGGDAADFQRVQAAIELLRREGRLS